VKQAPQLNREKKEIEKKIESKKKTVSKTKISCCKPSKSAVTALMH